MRRNLLFLWIMLSTTLLIFGQSSEKGLEGLWQVTLDAGGTKLRLEVIVTKSSTGEYSGKLNSLDQGSTIPIDEITLKGDVVRFVLNSIGGVFEGTLSKDRSELVGNWTQSGTTLPLTFKPASTTPSTQAMSRPAAQRPITVPFDMTVPFAPTAFQANGKMHLVYELHVTNLGSADCLLTRIEVMGDGEKPLTSYQGLEISSLLARPGAPPSVEKPRIGAGLRAVAFLWITLEPGATVPSNIRHRLTAKVGEYPEELSVSEPGTAVRKGPVVIGPPLRGGEWLAANGPANASAHRRAMIAVDGEAHIAQRFAIDWVQLREDGRTFTGDQKDNKNYRCYGADALAVSDSVVAAVKDGIPENVPGAASRAVPITLETIGGNHVILDLGSGRYAFYAHLQPGSVRVKVGDKVRRGQVLGLVGNSGNSTEPHLHFHISDANSPLGSEGLPYAFSEFEVQGRGWGWKSSGPQDAIEKRQMEIPLLTDVVRFSTSK